MNELSKYINNLPIDQEVVMVLSRARRARESRFDVNVPAPMIDQLPNGVVGASTIVSFDPKLSPTLRSSVLLSLVAAERVADSDKVAATPQLWTDRYNMTLKGLCWLSLSQGNLDQQLEIHNGSVHDAVLPFLSMALGPAATTTSLIVKALEQLKAMDDSTPWITLFDRESRRLDVSEYRFATVEDTGGTVVIRMAAARFSAKQDKVQILFFKKNDATVRFQVSSAMLAASTSILDEMNEALKKKLAPVLEQTLATIP